MRTRNEILSGVLNHTRLKILQYRNGVFERDIDKSEELPGHYRIAVKRCAKPVIIFNEMDLRAGAVPLKAQDNETEVYNFVNLQTE